MFHSWVDSEGKLHVFWVYLKGEKKVCVSSWAETSTDGAFKMSTNENVSRLPSDVHIEKGGKRIKCTAIWDTGASFTFVRPGLLSEFELSSSRECVIGSVGGDVKAKIYIANVEVPGKILFKDVKLHELTQFEDGIDMIIGMDIIKQGDFAVSCVNGRTEFSFRVPSKGIDLTHN